MPHNDFAEFFAPIQYGATPDEWRLFQTITGDRFTDLKPVVCRPDAPIHQRQDGSSSFPNAAAYTKVPSTYYNGKVGGLPGWPTAPTTQSDLSNWQRQPDYGICLRTAFFPAIDIDVDDPALARQIQQHIRDWFLCRGEFVPERYRDNSPRSAFLLRLDTTNGSLPQPKQVITTRNGDKIEILGNGQQIVVAGMHHSGSRIKWRNLSGASDLPTLTVDELNEFVAALQQKFGSTAQTNTVNINPHQQSTVNTTQPGTLEERLAGVREQDPVWLALQDHGMVHGPGTRPGMMNIVCPFAHEHTTPDVPSGTVYYTANTEGYATPAIKCQHAHCSNRTYHQFAEALGVDTRSRALDSDFEDLTQQETTPAGEGFRLTVPVDYKGPLDKLPWASPEDVYDVFKDNYKPVSLIENLINEGDSIILFGESRSGKTFVALEMAAAIRTGKQFAGLDTKKTNFLYVIAEDRRSFYKRLRAQRKKILREHPDIDWDDLKSSLYIIEEPPEFKSKASMREFRDRVRALERQTGITFGFIIFDTYAACRGYDFDENLAKDARDALANLDAAVLQEGKTYMMLHHTTGSDPNKIRGSTVLLSGVSTVLRVSAKRKDDVVVSRELTIVKQQTNDGEGLRVPFTITKCDESAVADFPEWSSLKEKPVVKDEDMPAVITDTVPLVGDLPSLSTGINTTTPVEAPRHKLQTVIFKEKEKNKQRIREYFQQNNWRPASLVDITTALSTQQRPARTRATLDGLVEQGYLTKTTSPDATDIIYTPVLVQP